MAQAAPHNPDPLLRVMKPGSIPDPRIVPLQVMSRKVMSAYIASRAVALAENAIAANAMANYLAIHAPPIRQALLRELLEDYFVLMPSLGEMRQVARFCFQRMCVVYPLFWEILFAPDLWEVVVPDWREAMAKHVRGTTNFLGLCSVAPGGYIPAWSRDLHAQVLEVISRTAGEKVPCKCDTLFLKVYLTREASSRRARSAIFSFPDKFRNVTTLNLGMSCDDSLLREIARMCLRIKSLTFSGQRVTDEGVDYLCGKLDNEPIADEYDSSDLCKTLTSLDIREAINIGKEGVRTLLLRCKNLERFQAEEDVFILALESYPLELSNLALTELELTRHFLPSLFTVCPNLKKLSVANQTSVSVVEPRVSRLETLAMRNCHPSLLRYLGRTLSHLEFDGLCAIRTGGPIDLYAVFRDCPGLKTMKFSNCCLGFMAQGIPVDCMMAKLSEMQLSSVLFTLPTTLSRLLTRCPALEIVKIYLATMNGGRRPVERRYMQERAETPNWNHRDRYRTVQDEARTSDDRAVDIERLRAIELMRRREEGQLRLRREVPIR